jgi:hypothetical protein
MDGLAPRRDQQRGHTGAAPDETPMIRPLWWLRTLPAPAADADAAGAMAAVRPSPRRVLGYAVAGAAMATGVGYVAQMLWQALGRASRWTPPQVRLVDSLGAGSATVAVLTFAAAAVAGFVTWRTGAGRGWTTLATGLAAGHLGAACTTILVLLPTRPAADAGCLPVSLATTTIAFVVYARDANLRYQAAIRAWRAAPHGSPARRRLDSPPGLLPAPGTGRAMTAWSDLAGHGGQWQWCVDCGRPLIEYPPAGSDGQADGPYLLPNLAATRAWLTAILCFDTGRRRWQLYAVAEHTMSLVEAGSHDQAGAHQVVAAQQWAADLLHHRAAAPPVRNTCLTSDGPGTVTGWRPVELYGRRCWVPLVPATRRCERPVRTGARTPAGTHCFCHHPGSVSSGDLS